MSRDYEAHITFPRRDEETVKRLALSGRWKFSRIDGDPVLGDAVFCYLTSYGRNYGSLKSAMDSEAQRARNHGAEVVRTKLEEILFDSRSSS